MLRDNVNPPRRHQSLRVPTFVGHGTLFLGMSDGTGALRNALWEMPAQQPSAGQQNSCLTSRKLSELCLSPGLAIPETEN